MKTLRRASALTCLLLVAVASCTGSTTPDDQNNPLQGVPDAGAQEAGGDANRPDADAGDAGRCTGPLDEVKKQWGISCAATYEEELASARNCGAAMEWNSITTCEGLYVVLHDWGTHRHACAYEGVGAAALVGAAASDDVPSFCDRTSWDITGGRVPASCNLAGYGSSRTLANEQLVCPLDAAVEGGPLDATEGGDSPDVGTHEAGDSATLPDADAGDAGRCTGPLDVVKKQWGSSCAATYEAELANARSCGTWEWNSIATCEGLHVVLHNWGTHGHACAYEGVGAAALVGAAASNDVPYFCDGTSWDITGGNVPASCNLAGYPSRTLANEHVVCPLDAAVEGGPVDTTEDGSSGDAAVDASDSMPD